MSAIASWLGYLVHGRPRLLPRKLLPHSTKPIPKRRRKPRRGPERLPEYRAFVRTQFSCAACGSWADVECAHFGPHGLSQKAPDKDVGPLCGSCHRWGPNALHRIGPKRFQEFWGIRFSRIIQECNRMWKEK